jgi:membrane protease YdiL (CAAX protease family)
MNKSSVKDFVKTDVSTFSRFSVFLIVSGVWAFSFYFLTPLLQSYVPRADNLSLLVKHLFYFSLPTAMVCLACYIYFLSKGSFKKLQFSISRKLVTETIVVALFCSAITIPFALKYGYHLGFNFEFEKSIGNLFSNTYEEFEFRVLIFFGALYLFRRPVPAALISGIAFAISHANYPLEFQIAILITGTLTAIVYFRTKSFVAAIAIHQMIDLILDTILIK